MEVKMVKISNYKLLILFFILLCTGSLYGYDKVVVKDSIPLVREKVKTIDDSKTDIPSNYFTIFSIGYSKLSIDNSVGSGVLENGALDDNNFIYDIGLGYKYNSDIFTTVNIARTTLDKLKLTNYYLSANYNLKIVGYSSYVGALVGYSGAKWTSSPIKDTLSSDLKLDSLLYGVQAGISKPLKDNLKLFAQYQFMILDHSLNVNNGVSKIKHKFQNNLIVGVKYEF
jgi:opacity protein-like surface antigen